MCESVLRRIKRGGKIGFFGLGKSNLSLISTLPLEKCRITLRSDQPIMRENIPRVKRVERIFDGERSCDLIDEDILIFSPSVRRERRQLDEARTRGVIFTSDLELFLEENEKPLFAVSGSDGKSTTATLAHLLMDNSLLVGNIGTPMLAALREDCQSYVAELSSFMLKYAKVPARRACITNITENHLDWHESFEEYRDTKLSLLESASECIVNADDEISMDFFKKRGGFGVISDRLGFDELRGSAELVITQTDTGIERNGRLVLPYESIRRREAHNIKNLMMAIALCDGYTDEDRMLKVANSFSGLPHRCEKFFEKDGVEYFNSSIDSSPARTAMTLESLGKRVVILLGGKSKGVGYDSLCESLSKYAEHALVFGENREEIYSAIHGCAKCEKCENIEDAILRAIELSGCAEAIILSPASTSYDVFSSFEERGNYFKKMILNGINRT